MNITEDLHEEYMHEEYMHLAITLAQKGIGYVNPNPLVGAVVVKEGKIISQGYHERYGELHAERNALASCIADPKDATMYVTLEPCCHYGKTPPCTEAIIEHGIRKVYVGCLDPNPLVAGRGVETLRQAGIEVITGVLENPCKKLNEIFIHYMNTRTPYVTMKFAMTMDGKIATCTGESRWISGEMSREKVHRDRSRYQGIMVGVGTVLADNPMLTSRISQGRNPIRIVCDSQLRTPLKSNIVRTAKEIPTILATSCTCPNQRKEYEQAGCEIVMVPLKDEHLDLQVLMQILGAKGIDSILLEGGSTLNFSSLNSGIVSKIQTYIAPKIFGGDLAKTAVGGKGFGAITECVTLKNQTVTYLGEDILIESEVEYPCLQES